MSYMLNSPCYYCTKKGTCKDVEKIQKAICEIHQTSYNDGHQGSGTITLQCINQETCN